MNLDELYEEIKRSLKYFDISWHQKEEVTCQILCGRLVLNHNGREIHIGLTHSSQSKLPTTE